MRSRHFFPLRLLFPSHYFPKSLSPLKPLSLSDKMMDGRVQQPFLVTIAHNSDLIGRRRPTLQFFKCQPNVPPAPNSWHRRSWRRLMGKGCQFGLASANRNCIVVGEIVDCHGIAVPKEGKTPVPDRSTKMVRPSAVRLLTAGVS
jgi:hypothetical protein